MISVSTKRVCGRCFSGYIENGICNRCHTRGEEKRSFNALPQGAKLYGGRYFIGDVLGIGGFGITYAAWDSQLFTRVAIKELFPDRGFSRLSDRVTVKPDQGQEEYFKHISYRFIEESSLLLGFADQPNIVSVYNAFSENHTVYYVMEFLEGKDLQHLVIETGKLNMQRLYPIVMPILDALEVLHKNNMIHRDIKPANIFITTNGSPKLIDFGSARVCHHNNSCSRYVTDGFAPYEQYVTNGKQGPWIFIPYA